MPVGDSQAQSYVTEELIRRSLGRHNMRQSNDVISINKDKGKVKNKLVLLGYKILIDIILSAGKKIIIKVKK